MLVHRIFFYQKSDDVMTFSRDARIDQSYIIDDEKPVGIASYSSSRRSQCTCCTIYHMDKKKKKKKEMKSQ